MSRKFLITGGSELMKRMLDKLNDMYMVDLLCDADIQSFYERFAIHQKTTAMLFRNMHE